MALIRGNINNCINCHSSYGKYDTNNEIDSDYKETWCRIPVKGLEPKGLCQFCNPKSRYFLSK